MEQTSLLTGYPLHRHDVQRIVQTVARRIVRLCHLARPAQTGANSISSAKRAAPRHHPRLPAHRCCPDRLRRIRARFTRPFCPGVEGMSDNFAAETGFVANGEIARFLHPRVGDNFG